MRFSLTTSTGSSAPDGRLAAPAADTAATAPAVSALPPDVVIDPFPFFTYEQETLRDAAGNITGYRDTSSGPGFWSISDYDSRFNLLRSEYRDSSGYRSTSLRSELRDAGGMLTGYRLESSGSGEGYRYTSTELFDTDYNLLSSEYSDSSGYRSSYRLEIERDAAGQVSGYVSHYSWSDGIATYTSIDRYDAAWNYIGGDSSKPDVIVDDGPMILPVITAGADGSARSALATATTSGGADSEVRDGERSVDLRKAKHEGIADASLTGRADLDVMGDGGDNRLSGNMGDNRLDGRGGSDTLFGGLGEDVFVIRGGRNGDPDTLADLISGEDHIALAGGRLRKLFSADGQLRDGVMGDRLVYDPASGELRFDRDGADGKAASVVLAVLVGVSDLDADDFTAG